MADKSRRILVVNADDFGYSEPRNKGIVEAFTSGLVSSVSLLVNGVSSKKAVKLAKEHGIPMGLHLNLTEGWPVGNKHASLVGSDGFFLGKFGFRRAVSSATVNLEEVRHEIIAQLEWFKCFVGSLPTHIDGHQHIHVLPGVRDTLVSVMIQTGILITRVPVELKLSECVWIEEPRMTFYSSVVKDAIESRNTFSASGIRFADYFIGLSTMGADMSESRLQQALDRIFKHTDSNCRKVTSFFCELMVHPGYRSIMGCGGCGQGPDEFACSLDREHELRVLKDATLAKYLVKSGVETLSFKDI